MLKIASLPWLMEDSSIDQPSRFTWESQHTSNDGDQIVILANLNIGSSLDTQSRDGCSPILSVIVHVVDRGLTWNQ